MRWSSFLLGSLGPGRGWGPGAHRHLKLLTLPCGLAGLGRPFHSAHPTRPQKPQLSTGRCPELPVATRQIPFPLPPEAPGAIPPQDPPQDPPQEPSLFLPSIIPLSRAQASWMELNRMTHWSLQGLFWESTSRFWIFSS